MRFAVLYLWSPYYKCINKTEAVQRSLTNANGNLHMCKYKERQFAMQTTYSRLSAVRKYYVAWFMLTVPVPLRAYSICLLVITYLN